VTGYNALVLHVQRHAARHLENAVGSADRPQRRTVAALFVAPGTQIRIVAGQYLAPRAVRSKNELLRRIDRERPAHSAGTPDRHFGFHVAVGGAIKHKKTRSVSPVTTTSARGRNEEIIYRVNSHRVQAPASVRPFDHAFGRYVPVGHAV